MRIKGELDSRIFANKFELDLQYLHINMKKITKILIGFFIFGFGLVLLNFCPARAQQSLTQGGNSFETAVLLSPGKYQGGPLEERQELYYSIQVKAGQEINAEAKYFSESGCTITLYNEAKEELISNYGENPKINWLANANKSLHNYYLKIANDASAVESFSLEVSLANYYDANSGTDAGDTFDKALTIVPGTYNGYLTGFSGIANAVGDDWQDIYKIGLKKGITYEFKAIPPSKTSLTLSLYDLNRQLLKEEESANQGSIVFLSLTPSADTNIFVSVLHGEYPYQDALVSYQLEVKSSASLIKFYVCDNDYCKSAGEFASKEDCQKATTKTCYQTENCDNKCGVPIPTLTPTSTPIPTIIPTLTPTSTPSPCKNECKTGQTKCFDNFNYQKCGNFDDDICLEWSTPVYCGEGNGCKNGKCTGVTKCKCSAWAQEGCGKNNCQQNEIYQTRTCEPKGCDKESQCLSDKSCSLTPTPTPAPTSTPTVTPSPTPTIIIPPIISKSPNWPLIGGIIAGGLSIIGLTVFLVFRKPSKDKSNKSDKGETSSPYYGGGSKEADKPVVGYKHPCRYCEKLIPPDSEVCPFCGKENPLGPMRCPKCHSPVEKDWQTCSHCGLNLRIVCPYCGKTTFFGDYCEDCGKKLTVICPSCQFEQPPISDKCIKCGKPLKLEPK